MAVIDLRVDDASCAFMRIPRVSVVVPTLNEAKNLPLVLPRIPEWVHEVILVDGGSTDDTVAVARELLPGVRIIVDERRGKGIALRRGFAEAEGEIVVMIDADGSMDPQEMSGYVGLLMAGADLVKGSRFSQGAGSADIDPLRRLGNLFFTKLVTLRFGSRYTDLCYGYAAFWADVIDDLELDGDGFEIETMLNVRSLRSDLVVVEAPSYEFQRAHGTSNLNTFRDGFRVLRTIGREAREERRERRHKHAMIGRRNLPDTRRRLPSSMLDLPAIVVERPVHEHTTDRDTASPAKRRVGA
jgi:glycosyltransferase involved in cell wall biosynthesis